MRVSILVGGDRSQIIRGMQEEHLTSDLSWVVAAWPAHNFVAWMAHNLLILFSQVYVLEVN